MHCQNVAQSECGVEVHIQRHGFHSDVTATSECSEVFLVEVEGGTVLSGRRLAVLVELFRPRPAQEHTHVGGGVLLRDGFEDPAPVGPPRPLPARPRLLVVRLGSHVVLHTSAGRGKFNRQRQVYLLVPIYRRLNSAELLSRQGGARGITAGGTLRFPLYDDNRRPTESQVR
jgi:hypothetical protein